MKENANASGSTHQGWGRDTRARLEAAGISYEVVAACNWCGVEPADPDRDMEGCCSEDCRYQLARDEGFVTDAEHEQYVAEGWAS